VTGPKKEQWAAICTHILVAGSLILYSIFFIPYSIANISTALPIITIVLGTVTEILTIYCEFTDPGIVEKEY